MAKQLTPELEIKKNEIIELIKSFSDKYLDTEYFELCKKLIEKMERKKSIPFERGKNEIWAAAVIHAIGTINFLFDKAIKPYSTVEEINNYFGTSKSTTGSKSKEIRDMFDMYYYDGEFSTNRMLEGNPFNKLFDLSNLFKNLNIENQKQNSVKTLKLNPENHSSKIYQLKISLDGITPPVYRKIQISCNATLFELHCIIQDAMGWDDYHLFMFEIDNLKYAEEDDDEMAFENYESLDTELCEVVTEIKQKFKYEYDFGDSWLHTIVLEKIIEPEPGKTYPVCIDGKRACPPEDCGGTWGYMDILEKHEKGTLKKDKELWEWLDKHFDPEYFNIDEVNDLLQ